MDILDHYATARIRGGSVLTGGKGNTVGYVEELVEIGEEEVVFVEVGDSTEEGLEKVLPPLEGLVKHHERTDGDQAEEGIPGNPEIGGKDQDGGKKVGQGRVEGIFFVQIQTDHTEFVTDTPEKPNKGF